ncbi:molybdopterin molybdotransferase MoeA [Mesoterricola silvestris]|uniref:molybdopterin molybdotransferase MoeA n=1 Tax=Mesoterricola silvestris TaxID=2927979 RepID=UPI00292D8B96|nr:gephyrin-like molybdotransferase Glp [Mesoterricola silvestris]
MKLVLERAVPLAPRRVPLMEALGLAAAEDILAREPVPPFTNSAMDGFALRAADAGPGRLPVAGTVPAGMAEVPALGPGEALRIMTGAPVPAGADVILPLEHVRVEGDWVILPEAPRRGANIRLQGEDIPAGGRVVPAGAVLRPAEVGVLAAIGCPEVPVRPRPRVAVITTGNELVDAGDRPGPGQIRDANIHSLCAQVLAAGGVPLPRPRVEDRRETVARALLGALGEADVVLTNGGISVGDFDYIKAVLEDNGAERVFWKVAQKPGSPLGLWVLGGKLIFGIPGNPVAAMLMFEEYVRPAVRRMMGYRNLHRPARAGVLEEGWTRSGDARRTEFLRVVAGPGGRVALAGPQGSGILSGMMRANALAVIPEGPMALEAGAEVLLHLLDEAEDH